MTTEQIIRANVNRPIGQSIQPVASSLAGKSIFVATDATASTEPADVVLTKLRFKTANDSQGRTWAYAYTSKDELLRTFPGGSPYLELKFADFFNVINRDQKFAGIFLNSGSDASFPVPREVFGSVAAAIH